MYSVLYCAPYIDRTHAKRKKRVGHPSPVDLTSAYSGILCRQPITTTCYTYTARGRTIDDNPPLPTEMDFGSCVNGGEALVSGAWDTPLDAKPRSAGSKRGKDRTSKEVMGGTRSQMLPAADAEDECSAQVNAQPQSFTSVRQVYFLVPHQRWGAFRPSLPLGLLLEGIQARG